MKLYHFTAKRFVNSIKKTGLSKGMIPVSIKPPKFLPNYQWLTSNASFNQHCLKGSGLLPYSRTEARFEIHIPEEHHDKLNLFFNCKHLCPDLFDVLVSQGDPENWYIYHGFIPNSWLRKLTFQKEVESE